MEKIIDSARKRLKKELEVYAQLLEKLEGNISIPSEVELERLEEVLTENEIRNLFQLLFITIRMKGSEIYVDLPSLQEMESENVLEVYMAYEEMKNDVPFSKMVFVEVGKRGRMGVYNVKELRDIDRLKKYSV